MLQFANYFLKVVVTRLSLNQYFVNSCSDTAFLYFTLFQNFNAKFGAHYASWPKCIVRFGVGKIDRKRPTTPGTLLEK